MNCGKKGFLQILDNSNLIEKVPFESIGNMPILVLAAQF